MSLYADQGTAAHTVLEACLLSIYGWDVPLSPHEYVGKQVLVEDGPHARMSPSGAKRWMACPASVKIGEQYPEPEQAPREITFDDGYARAVQQTLDYIATRVTELEKEGRGPVKVYAERRVSPEWILGTHDHDGTVDVIVLAKDFVEIVDFKAGAGVPVMPTDPQLDLYLLGLLGTKEFFQHVEGAPHPIQSARVTISQPRCDKVGPRIRSRDIENLWGAADATGWIPMLQERVAEARRRVEEEPDAFGPSEEGCRWCPVGGQGGRDGRPVCGAYEEYALRQAGVLADGMPLPETSDGVYEVALQAAAADTRFLSPAQLRGLLDAREMLQGALQAAEAYCQARLLEGSAAPEIAEAYKLVPGGTRLAYTEKDEAENVRRLKRISIEDPDTGKTRKLGKKDLFETKLKTAPRVRDMLKGFGIGIKDARMDAFFAIAKKPEGKPTIAPIDDPRTAISPQANAEEAFGGDNQEEIEAPPLP